MFSNSVYRGLIHFRSVPELNDSQATGEFCKWINDLFDALNRKEELEGVTPGNIDFKVRLDLLAL